MTAIKHGGGARFDGRWMRQKPRHREAASPFPRPAAPDAAPSATTERLSIAVVIPCYRVTAHVLDVLRGIGPEVEAVYCVDDACPDGSGDVIQEQYRDGRVTVLRLEKNVGVGGATLAGYSAAIAGGAEVIVKIDGDGQMDPKLLSRFVQPIRDGWADYVKGNRFANLEGPKGMPGIRLFGNASLSFLNKLSSGYWNIFDPTNGYTAIHGDVARRIVRRSVAQRYFFESDMLYHLNMMRAVVTDVPMKARYGDEQSNLSIRRALFPFIGRHLRNTGRRILLQYFLRDFSLASIELVIGLAALAFGTGVGIHGWLKSAATMEPATAGTVMLAALPVIVGVQLLLNAVNYDIQSVPRMPLHLLLKRSGQEGG